MIYIRKVAKLLINTVIAEFGLLICVLLSEQISADLYQYLIWLLLVAAICFFVSFALYKIYNIDFESISIYDVIKIVLSIISASCMIFLVDTLFKQFITFPVFFYSIFVNCAFISVFNMYKRVNIILSNKIQARNNASARRVLIIGAGYVGKMLINSMINKYQNAEFELCGLIDDDPQKLDLRISGIKVLGGREVLNKAITEKNIDLIIIAIANLKNEDKKDIINICKTCGCTVKTVTDYSDSISNRSDIRLREVNLEDLLERETVQIDIDQLSDLIENKVVMVTGGGGSIGSEICRQVVKYYPKLLVVVDISENYIYSLKKEFQVNAPTQKIVYHIATIRELDRLEELFEMYGPNIIFHAAAHKHVPLMQVDVCEAVKNNIFGTLNLCNCALKFHVDKFVLISTDKAVYPTSIMGVTKRICEMIVSAYNSYHLTRFVAVRFGNVLGSNGSVVEIFKKQIEMGGPITITNENMVRYFMTIKEAACLVLQAAAFSDLGSMFLLEMGEPIKIYDLACDMMRLMGYRPGIDIEILLTGLREGEKLYEELHLKNEVVLHSPNQSILMLKQEHIDLQILLSNICFLEKAIDAGENSKVREIILNMVPENSIGTESYVLDTASK